MQVFKIIPTINKVNFLVVDYFYLILLKVHGNQNSAIQIIVVNTNGNNVIEIQTWKEALKHNTVERKREFFVELFV